MKENDYGDYCCVVFENLIKLLMSMENVPQPVSPLPMPPVAKPKNKKNLITTVLVSLVLCSVIAYFIAATGSKGTMNTNKKQSQVQLTSILVPTTALQSSLFSGKLKRLSQNLQLFNTTQTDQFYFVYYE